MPPARREGVISDGQAAQKKKVCSYGVVLEQLSILHLTVAVICKPFNLKEVYNEETNGVGMLCCEIKR